MATTDTLVNIRQTTLAALRTHIGRHWQDVQGELQLSHNEMPTWILLYQDSDPAEAHRVLRDILAPCMDEIAPVQFTVSYAMLTDAFDITIEALMDNDEILGALDRPGFGKVPSTTQRHTSGVFGAAVSGLRPASG
jgi:hypothetical protein